MVCEGPANCWGSFCLTSAAPHCRILSEAIQRRAPQNCQSSEDCNEWPQNACGASSLSTSLLWWLLHYEEVCASFSFFLRLPRKMLEACLACLHRSLPSLSGCRWCNLHLQGYRCESERGTDADCIFGHLERLPRSLHFGVFSPPCCGRLWHSDWLGGPSWHSSDSERDCRTSCQCSCSRRPVERNERGACTAAWKDSTIDPLFEEASNFSRAPQTSHYDGNLCQDPLVVLPVVLHGDDRLEHVNGGNCKSFAAGIAGCVWHFWRMWNALPTIHDLSHGS